METREFESSLHRFSFFLFYYFQKGEKSVSNYFLVENDVVFVFFGSFHQESSNFGK
jgi:hypothetical protein